MYTAIIEIPKGDDRRRHLKYDRSGFIDLGPLREVIPLNDGLMPIHYGYIQGLSNPLEAGEFPEYIDVLVYSLQQFAIGEAVLIKPLGLWRRADHDEKVLAVPSAEAGIARWEDISETERALLLSYFSYKSPITEFVDAVGTEQFLASLAASPLSF